MDLSAYKDGQDGLTIMVFDKDKQEVVDSVRSRLGRSKDISDPVRRKNVVQNIQRFLKEMESVDMTAKLHGVYIITDGKLEFFTVPRTFVETWSLKSYALFQDIPKLYLDDVFNNSQSMTHAVRVSPGNKFMRMEGTLHKHREVGSLTLVELMKMDVPFVLFGKGISQKLEIPKTAVASVTKDLTWTEIMDLHQRKERLEIHRQLGKIIDMMNHPRDSQLLLYKKDIPMALEEYTIKELYVLRSKCQDMDTTENTSVKIIVVDPVEPGDLTEKFDKDLEGILGVKYYA